MGALRKAGVWLGLVEDEDDRHGDGLFDDEFAEDDDFEAAPARPRSLARPAQRGGDPRRDDSRQADSRQADSRQAESRRDDYRDREPRDREARERDLRERDSRPAPEREVRSERELRELRELRTQRDSLDRADRGLERGVRGSELPDPRVSAVEPRSPEPRSSESRSSESRSSELRSPDLRPVEPRASVRPLGRPASTPATGSTAMSYPTSDNLALAPQVQLRERGVVADDRDRPRRPQITTLHPTSYSEARAIGEQFRDGHPVIMNLTEMDEPDAKRLVDFAAGLAFGLRGGMERVTNRVFLLSPPNVQVSAEDKARIAEGGFFNQT